MSGKEEIIEKKIDLLYRMYIDDKFNFRDHLDELILLFDLSIEMERIKIKGFVVEDLIEKYKEAIKELDKLKSDKKSGNFLAKDKDKITKLIYNQEEKIRALTKIRDRYSGIKDIGEDLRKELLMLDLKEKIGISLSEERDNYDRNDFWHKETLEEKLKNAIDWMQEELKEYKKKFG